MMNKFVYVQGIGLGDPCVVSYKLNKFEYVWELYGEEGSQDQVPVGRYPSHLNRQTDKETRQ